MKLSRLFKEFYLGINRPKKKKLSALPSTDLFAKENMEQQEPELSEEEQVKVLEESRELLEQFGFNVEDEISQLREELRQHRGEGDK